MAEELFHIRDVREEDLPILTDFAYAEGMGEVLQEHTVFVAVNSEDEPIGFIRLVFDKDDICHVNPVVVYPTWRGYGVGRVLMEYAQDKYGELRLVSRGGSLAFYQALGFEAIPMDMIHPPIAAECDDCEIFDECHPTPMRKKAPGKGSASN